MASPFSRTLRSLQADGTRRWTAGLFPAVLLLSAWAAWFLAARVSVYEVTDQAWLAVDREGHPIAAPVAGRVAAVRAALGQAVQAGEVLIELEGDEPRARLDEERAKAAALGHQIAALRQQIASGRQALGEGRNATGASLAEARAKAAEAASAARLAEQEAERQKRLLADGLVSAAEAERARSLAEQRRAAAESLRLTVDRLTWSERSGQSDRRSEIDKLERDLAELEGQAAGAVAAVRGLERDLALRTIRAPVAGRIGQLAPVRAGAVLAAGEQLGTVVPAGEIKGIADFAPASALGRIRPGQPARIYLSGFPSTQYGHLPATVARVAGEPRDGRIRVELTARPARGPGGSRLPLEHGLPGTIEVEVERVTPAVLVLRTIGKVFEQPIPAGASTP
jgi:membrane fusion protein (multidrug efflux system)